MNADQFRRNIVRPALRAIGLHSVAAENLVMGTAAVESGLEYVRQLHNGPALSLFQIEPRTHDDIWENYLAYRRELAETLLAAIAAGERPPADRLIWDLRYSAIMCRIHYKRVPELLPDADDIWGMARYYKTFYNTVAGKAKEHDFVDSYRLVR